MTLSSQVAELEQSVVKSRCNAAYWRVQYMFLKNICEQRGIDLKLYYQEAERTAPKELT